MQSFSGKEAAARAALALVEPGMSLGLGSGSTAALFINFLGERCRAGLAVCGLPTSLASELLARSYGIPLIDADVARELDLTIDGADEIDPKKRLIKGGGGALLREKVVASISKEMIVIADESKLVKTLGHFPLPVEIIPFAYLGICEALARRGHRGTLRPGGDGKPYLTDEGNYIIDLVMPTSCPSPEALDSDLHTIPGVVETGLFLGMAGRIFIGNNDGTVCMLS